MNALPSLSGNNIEKRTAETVSEGQPVNDGVLPADVRGYIQASLSDSSRRAYRSDLNHFLSYGGTIPATPEMIAGYLAAHAAKHAIATLSRRLVSIGKAHTSQGIPSPTSSELVKARGANCLSPFQAAR